MAKIQPDELCPCGSGLLFKDCHKLRIKQPQKPNITTRSTLTVIPEPDPNTRSVFIYDGEGTTVFQGYDSNLELICGNCSSPLVSGINRNQISNIVIRCKQCGKFNEV
ncbi:SEC-C domain-containing protein [Vibrio vulnificus]|uniref:SEC-C metal-binding domain-containing protein n=1 Tax=Vibrio parahaemolyticus TaxID=670 RepID=UPI00287D0CCB|nr:SEC-C metal-binding domain-containing protein [Vibrio parahaemolyticus]EHU5129695.1 SEC-C domain-containing protein [Vibrio vulnificus]EJC6852896.1 SEC-C domain-containing protein [Vibrio parahaemolyticus]EJN6713625.1 SEC-C domain-containing protein [Vibrio vulnificus]ELG4951828.1 SEC-C domain-containing protein [Vibrio vulnificus]WMO01728.1 SEC-C metal-binding domain-containing protein [Vibrio parahaemolyticus]